MGELRVHNFSISLDGYGAGPDQSLENPLGVGGERLHEWFFPPDGSPRDPIAEEFVRRARAGAGATIMGRNMFGPVRGEWPDASWTGWWGEEPPYHHDVFVLTHFPRPSFDMSGGTTFHFVTDGIEAALERAQAAAGDRHIVLGGGVSTVQQYLRAGLLDELHVVIAPIVLGGGERLFDRLDGALDGWAPAEISASPMAAHVRLRPTRRGSAGL
jgi:dihydrofolate reductase